MTTRGLFYIPASTPAQEHLKRVAKRADEERKKKANGPFQATLPTPTPGAPVNRALFQAGFPLGVAQRVEEPRPPPTIQERARAVEPSWLTVGRTVGGPLLKGAGIALAPIQKATEAGMAGLQEQALAETGGQLAIAGFTSPRARKVSQEVAERPRDWPSIQQRYMDNPAAFRFVMETAVWAAVPQTAALRAPLIQLRAAKDTPTMVKIVAGAVEKGLLPFDLVEQAIGKVAGAGVQAIRRGAVAAAPVAREAALAPARLLTGAVGEGAGGAARRATRGATAEARRLAEIAMQERVAALQASKRAGRVAETRVYISPQGRYEVGGRQVLVNLGDIARQQGLVPDPQDLNYWRLAEETPTAPQARAAEVARGQAEMPITPIEGVRSLPDMVAAQIARRDAALAAKPPRVRRAAHKPAEAPLAAEPEALVPLSGNTEEEIKLAAKKVRQQIDRLSTRPYAQQAEVASLYRQLARAEANEIERLQKRVALERATGDLVQREGAPTGGNKRPITKPPRAPKPAAAPVAAEPVPMTFAPASAIAPEVGSQTIDPALLRRLQETLEPPQNEANVAAFIARRRARLAANKPAPGAAPPPAPPAAGQGLSPAPAAPVAAAGAPPPVSPPLATAGAPPGGGVPPVARAVPPTGGGVPAQPPGITKALRQARAITELQRPGVVSAKAGRVPVAGQVLEYIKPVRGMFQKGNEFLGESWVGRGRVKSTLMTEANSTYVPLMNDLDRAFGKDATKGLPIPTARFTGTAAERAPWSDTLYDIIQRPGLYQLTPEQTALLQRFHQRNTALLEKVNQEFGTEIGRFENPQGFFLPNKDVSEDALEVLETLGRSQRSALVSGQAKTRIFDTAFDRWKADPSFVPETNVRALTSAMDGFKASAAAAETFRTGIGGKTLLEVVEETHPALLKMKQDLTRRVANLKGRLSTARAGVTTSAAAQRASARKLTSTEAKITDLQTDIAALGNEWGPELSFLSGELRQLMAQAKRLGADVLAARTRLTGQAGRALNLADELDDTVELLDQVRRSYKAANLHGYTLVREGNLFRYFKADQAASVRQLLETSNNPALNFIENIRLTAFVADASPIVGVQAPLHWFAAPLQTSKDWIGGAVRGAQKGDILGAFKSEQLAKDIAANPQSYEDFSFYMGLELGGVPEEFSVGFLSKLPKIGRQIGVVNESMFNAVLRESKNHFDAHVANFLKDGMAPDQAKAMAAQMVRTVNPLWDPAAMGLSEARARLLRTPLTSVSFLLKPAELSANGISGMMKIGLGQAKKLTPQERVSVRVLLTMAASLTGVTVASAGINAVARGKDPLVEIQEVLDPQSGRWWTLSIGDRRVPIGGPFRSLFKAVVPSKYRELGAAPYPFDNFGRFAMSKMTPFLSTQLELARNKDYFGDPILKGRFAERLLRFTAYEIEGMIPLTAGAAIGAARTGQGLGTAAEEAASQFLGTSAYKESPFQRRDAGVREWAKGKGIMGVQGYSDLLPATQKQYDLAHSQTSEMVKVESKRRREQRGDVPWLPVEAGELSEKSWEEFYGTVDETNRQFLKAFPEAERLEVYLGVVGNSIANLEMTKALRRRYQEFAGQQALQLLPLILQREVYRQAKDERKREMLQGVLSLAREKARVQMLPLLREQMAEETRQGVSPPTPTPTPAATPFSQPSTPRSGGVLLVPVGAGR